jgi:ribose transport system permease protein
MNIIYLLFWVGVWAVAGALLTAALFRNKGRQPETGAIVGAISGALGGILLLVFVWLVVAALPAPGDSETAKLKNSDMPVRSHIDLAVRFVVLLVVIILLMLIEPRLREGRILNNLLVVGSLLSLIAMALTLVMRVRGIDLSLLALSSLAGVVLANIVNNELGVVMGIGAAVIIGLACGTMQGLFAAVRIPSFIVTLIGLGFWQTIALGTTEGRTVIIRDEGFRELATGQIAGIPTIFLLVVGIAIFGQLLVSFTPYGRYLSAAGESNRFELSHFLAILSAFMLAGLLAGVHAVFMTSRLQSAYAQTGSISAPIAAAVLGGASFFRSKGWFGGAIIGALFVAILQMVVVLLQVSPYLQEAIYAFILLLAVAVDRVQYAIVQYRQSGQAMMVETPEMNQPRQAEV